MSKQTFTQVYREIHKHTWHCDCCRAGWECGTDSVGVNMPYLRSFKIATDANSTLKEFDFCIDCLAFALQHGKGLRWLATGEDRPRFTGTRKRWYPKLVQQKGERAPFNMRVVE